MTQETIKKRDELISYLGSVEKYQAGIFHKIPPVFLMTCDSEGNVIIDKNSVVKYLEKEMEEHSITIAQLIERDKKVFGQLIDDYYLEVFGK